MLQYELMLHAKIVTGDCHKLEFGNLVNAARLFLRDHHFNGKKLCCTAHSIFARDLGIPAN